MKISPIRANNTSFSYNQKYHSWVKQELKDKSKNDQTAKTLLDLENMSLNMEDKLVKMENSYKGLAVNSAKYEIIADCLINLKTNIAYYMDKYFPYLEFSVTEMDQYSKEIGEHSNEMEYYWRGEIINDIAGNDILAHENYADFKDIPNTKDPYSDMEKKPKIVTDADKESVSKLLTEFYPTFSSPEGLDDVIGIDETKQILREDILDYIENPELQERDKEEYGIESCGTILFYGPPGCGKTYITEALASESGLRMFKMDVSKIGSKYVNQTAGNIQKAFDFLEKVAQEEEQPVLLFIDELDSLAIRRESSMGSSGENLKTTSTLLKQIQEAKDKNIIVIGATNRRNIIDSALLDRFGAEAYFGLPDEKTIKKILISKLEKISKGKNLAQDEKAVNSLAKSIKGYSIRSIVHIIQEAAKTARRNSRSDITFEIFNKVISESEHEKIDERLYQKESKTRVIGFTAN